MAGPWACRWHGSRGCSTPRPNSGRANSQSAPVTVINPARTHAAKSHPGEPTSRDDSADVMKMPEPIIDPMTIIVASTQPSSRTSAGDCTGSSLVKDMRAGSG